MGNSPVLGEFPTQRPVTRSFDVFFDLHLNKWLSKELWGWWFETPSCPLWRHCSVTLLESQPHLPAANELIKLHCSHYLFRIKTNAELSPLISSQIADFPFPVPLWSLHCPGLVWMVIISLLFSPILWPEQFVLPERAAFYPAWYAHHFLTLWSYSRRGQHFIQFDMHTTFLCCRVIIILSIFVDPSEI